MRRRALVLVLSLAVLSQTGLSAQDLPLAGFSGSSSRSQREREGSFNAIPSPQRMRDYMQRLSARPHHVGSAYGRENAEWILAQFRAWGLDAHIETFEVLFPTPKERVLEMVAPRQFTAKLQEPVVPADPTSDQTREQLPTYNAYSPDGDVTGPLVFVNYGLPEDYEQLERLGVSVRGAIVLAKYGRTWRGTKPKVAAEHGAVGCIIYSDPRDDGYFVDNVFPAGPMRPDLGVQRGSVLDFPSFSPGDPLTPGIGATADAKRLPIEGAPGIQKIPVLPIAYGDAQPLLAALTGPMAPESWRGALAVPYRLGPGASRVHLKLSFNWEIKTVYDVIAKIPGTVESDQWIIRGNHHDAWVNGAADPVSGLIALLEEARALGELLKTGWKPRRTIIYCAWDGEEPILLGSTEWAEAHGSELREHAVAYLNTDSNARGYLEVGGSHTLEKFINNVARDIVDPESKTSVWKRAQAAGICYSHSEEERNGFRSRADLRIQPLGSGSDYSVFLDHLGIASLNLGYDGEDDSGIYHSIYDDFYWYTHFSDTEFLYARALAQTVGTAVLRLADAEVLPFEFGGFADTMKKFNEEVQNLLKSKQQEIAERNRQIDDGIFQATNDPRRPQVVPTVQTVPPHLNFAPLQNAIDRLTRSATEYEAALGTLRQKGIEQAPPGALNKLNRTLMQSERRLTDPAGLPQRPWYKHLIYAPGVYSGYSPKTLAGVREAIEQKRYQEAEPEIARIARVLNEEATLIDSAIQQLKEATQ